MPLIIFEHEASRIIDPINFQEDIDRLNTLLRRVTQSQPVAAADMLILLYRSSETGQATLDVSVANLQEIQRNWN